MSILFYAVNDQSKQAVELGKHDYPPMQNRAFSSSEELAQVLLEEIADFYDPNPDPIANARRASFLASELWKIGTSYRVVSEDESGAPYVGYLIVGSQSEEVRGWIGTDLSTLMDAF